MIDVPSVRGAASAAGWLLRLPVRGLRWARGQVRGFAANVRAVPGAADLSDLPPIIRGTVRWLLQQVPRALGAGSPSDQIVASIVLAVLMIVSSFGVLTPLAVVFIIPFTVGVVRLVPAVNSGWKRSRAGVGSGRRRISNARKWRRK